MDISILFTLTLTLSHHGRGKFYYLIYASSSKFIMKSIFQKIRNPQFISDFPRQTPRSKNTFGIHGGFDAVHHLPSRSWGTEDVIIFPEIIGRF